MEASEPVVDMVIAPRWARRVAGRRPRIAAGPFPPRYQRNRLAGIIPVTQLNPDGIARMFAAAIIRIIRSSERETRPDETVLRYTRAGVGQDHRAKLQDSAGTQQWPRPPRLTFSSPQPAERAGLAGHALGALRLG